MAMTISATESSYTNNSVIRSFSDPILPLLASEISVKDSVSAVPIDAS